MWADDTTHIEQLRSSYSTFGAILPGRRCTSFSRNKVPGVSSSPRAAPTNHRKNQAKMILLVICGRNKGREACVRRRAISIDRRVALIRQRSSDARLLYRGVVATAFDPNKTTAGKGEAPGMQRVIDQKRQTDGNHATHLASTILLRNSTSNSVSLVLSTAELEIRDKVNDAQCFKKKMYA